MTDSDQIITPKMLLQHMQAGFNAVNIRLDKIEIRLESIESRLADLERRVSDLVHNLRVISEHELPERVSRLEDKVFAGIDPV